MLSSGSHGRHSRPRSSPSQGSTKYELSVLEALADWWLLGEADLGVLGAFDYGGDHGVGSYAPHAINGDCEYETTDPRARTLCLKFQAYFHVISQ